MPTLERTIAPHAFDRIAGRLAEERVTFSDRALARLAAYAQREDSAAFLLVELPRTVGAFDTSNGNQVWAIVRNGQVRTVMFRRADQPPTCAALRVDTVYVGAMFDIRDLSKRSEQVAR